MTEGIFKERVGQPEPAEERPDEEVPAIVTLEGKICPYRNHVNGSEQVCAGAGCAMFREEVDSKPFCGLAGRPIDTERSAIEKLNEGLVALGESMGDAIGETIKEALKR